MRREISWGEEALSELEAAHEQVAAHVGVRGLKFIKAVEAKMSSLLEFPLQGSLVDAALAFPIRRVLLRPFGFVLYYTVYPSVDFQTGDPLDVIYFLACRHDKQGQPTWSSRDPFR